MNKCVIPSAARNPAVARACGKARSLVAPLLGMTLVFGVPAAHAAVAGNVLFTLGRVEVQRGSTLLTAQRGSTVEEGDVITTGPTGMGQIRLKDGTLLALKPGASMQIEEFKYQPAPIVPAASATPAPSAAPSVVREGSRSVLRLLKGAFRTITGAIGKSAGDDYRVITPSATIGIRGTDYSVAYCSGDCGNTPNGLYVGVSNGEIFVTNDVGQLVLGDNQYAYVKDSNTPPDQQVAPPDVLETPIEGGEGEEGDDDGEEPGAGFDQGAGDGAPRDGIGGGIDTGGPAEYSDPEGTYELQPGEPGVFAFGTGPLQGAATFVSAGANGIYTDDQGHLIGFLAPDTTGVTFYSMGTATNAQHGFDPDTGIHWGRWSEGTTSVGGQDLDLSNQSLHWIYAAAENIPVLPVSGTASYSLVGNTNPTDSNGAVGFLGSATFSADFTNQTVTSTLAIGFGDVSTGAGSVWQASGSGMIFANTPLFAGNYSSVSVDNLTAGNSGSFSGFFTDNALGAGLSYSLTNGTTTVSGAAAFGSPTPGAP